MSILLLMAVGILLLSLIMFFYYRNSNVRNEFWETKLSTIEDIKLTIQNIESSYRNAKIKEFELTNYRTIFDTLLKHERQKKLDLILI